jgi:N6-L-threonylcarbamoyladenine synthase
VYGMDHRYCIDNGAMIAQAGLLEYISLMKREGLHVGAKKQEHLIQSLATTTVTQRFRTDEVFVSWR